MKLTTIDSLFQQVMKISKYKRKNKLNFDGKAFWQPIKEILSTSSWKASKWKKQSTKRYKSLMELPEFYINGYGKQAIIEKNHFLIQTVRIPKEEEPSLKKVIQIGLNIGQYEGNTDKEILNNNINDFLLKKDSNTFLHKILHKNSILQLETLLKK